MMRKQTPSTSTDDAVVSLRNQLANAIQGRDSAIERIENYKRHEEAWWDMFDNFKQMVGSTLPNETPFAFLSRMVRERQEARQVAFHWWSEYKELKAYRAALDRVHVLMCTFELTDDELLELDNLSLFCQSYERKHYPIDPPTQEAMEEFRKDQEGFGGEYWRKKWREKFDESVHLRNQLNENGIIPKA